MLMQKRKITKILNVSAYKIILTHVYRHLYATKIFTLI